ncbi:MAG: translation initiation factor IF-2 [Anaerolineae bacterium]|nr:translation initiation factor IF-2 [Anaerolineae bacterium]
MGDKLVPIEISEFITVRELASSLQVSPIDVIKELMNNGIMANINQQLDFDTAAIISEEFGFEARLPVEAIVEAEEEEELPLMARILADEKLEDLKPRPPVVTLLGHVDHGKTSLLDTIRSTNVQSGEVGGITQHIGAYQITYSDKKITFLDTPGHEAFTAMRARGAQGADIAILVVAADDGVMPQTKEAISHAKAAHVPIIIALNKIDLPGANQDRVKQQLSDEGLTPEDWGGENICVPVSAKMKTGIEDILESILLVAEVNDFRANPDRAALGVVVEAEMSKTRGPTATFLVQNGTLAAGDAFVVGEEYGRVRAMFDFQGNRLDRAGPSTPAQVLGLSGVPAAGDRFRIVEDERTARLIALSRTARREETVSAGPEISLEQLFERFQSGEAKDLNIIIKADVQGSLEPIVNSIEDLSNDEISVNVIHQGTGNINESDIMLAIASQAIVIGFNVNADTAARRQAESEGVEIRLYNIIYSIIDDVEKALKGMLAPVFQDVISGHAQVRAVFHISRVGNIAGCYVTDGAITRNGYARLLRNQKVLFDGRLSSLKHFQEDVREVRAGFECGIGLEGFNDMQEGDVIQAYRKERVS